MDESVDVVNADIVNFFIFERIHGSTPIGAFGVSHHANFFSNSFGLRIVGNASTLPPPS